MEIRKASLTDYDAIYAIALPAWQQGYKNILSQGQTDYMLQLMYSRDAIAAQIEKGHRFLLAINNENHIGFISYEIGYKPLTTKIHKLYVHPAAQGYGVGHALVLSVQDEAIGNSQEIITLNVNRLNPAVGFYKKSGFHIAAEEDIAIGHGYLMEDYVMEKKL